ncbi:MAG: GNAT family N-acetyltransferase [Thiothrix sp.]|nr:GNAT family N-acetyltransferase [Thiothrix sp.]HPE61983.1 GNAT family N-acetyltransferase [Thiolinea sp.]
MSQIPLPFTIRRAEAADAAALADFNRLMALETEHRQLLPAVILAGVEGLLRQPQYGFYLVAEHEKAIVGALMVTTEWSDWRNGIFWWVQSVYVTTAWRRKGVYRALYHRVRELAAQEPCVCGFRLYVERDNRVAQAVYRELGMQETAYLLFEALRSGVHFPESGLQGPEKALKDGNVGV